MNNLYEGWELSYFDQADNFRNYEFSLCKNYISGKTAEVGPGTGENIKYYLIVLFSGALRLSVVIALESHLELCCCQ